MVEAKRWMVVVTAVALAAVVFLGSTSPEGAGGAAEQGFQFGVIGDLGYEPAEEAALANVLEELNKASLDFVVHVGDLSGDAYACTDEDYSKRLGQFQASVHPLIYTPGDNEWTDCHRVRPNRPVFEPVERLNTIRQRFFANEETLGRRTLAVWRQSRNPAYAKFRENMRFAFRDVMVMTVHVMGSNNNFGRTAEQDEEWAERNEANVVWLVDGFNEAKRMNSKGIVIFAQANMFSEFTPGEPGAGFADFLKHLREQTLAFGKPVLLVHGDTHTFRVDKPLSHTATYDPTRRPQIENFTRLEGFGTPNHHWVLVTVDPGDPEVFLIRQRFVAKNLRVRS